MATVTEVRKGEIALLMIKDLAKERGIPVSDLRQRSLSEAKKYGITQGEYLDFIESISRELIDEAFGEARRPEPREQILKKFVINE